MDVAYQRAKAAKGAERAKAAGKVLSKKSEQKPARNKNRKLDVEEPSVGEKKQMPRGSQQGRRRKPGVSRKAFKSKAR